MKTHRLSVVKRFIGAAVALAALFVSSNLNAEDIAGFYYFKGIRLLEVREQGGSLVAEFYGEKEDAAKMREISQGSPSPLPGAPTSGQRLAANQVEITSFPLSLAGVLSHLNPGSGISPEVFKEQFARQFSGDGKAPSWLQALSAGESKGQYYERWTLLPEGRLQIECALPILNPTWGDHTAAQTELLAKLGTSLGSQLGDHKQVCAWKATEPREIQAWRAIDSGDCAGAATLFHDAAEAQPTRPFACFGEASARIGTKEFDLARKALDAGRSRLNDETRPFFLQHVFVLKEQIDAYETAATGTCFVDALSAYEDKIPLIKDVTLVQETKDKPVRLLSPGELRGMRRAVDAFQFWPQAGQTIQLRGTAPLLPLGQKLTWLSTLVSMKVPNLLKFQTLARLMSYQGHLARESNDCATAIRSYAAAVHMGQSMRHGVLISHLIGIAMESIGGDGLRQLVEDGLVDQPPVVQAFQQFADYLYSQEPSAAPAEMFAFEHGYPLCPDSFQELTLRMVASPNLLEAQTRAKTVSARLALLKAAADLKQTWRTGPPPDAAPADTLPPDPFAPGDNVRYRFEGDRALLYSVGPDGKDDHGAIQYDSKNGTASPGDVTLTLK